MNDAPRSVLFREVNERIAEIADTWSLDDVRGVLCECDSRECGEAIDLTRAEYEAVRAHPARFVTVVAHLRSARERVVEQRDGYVVVEKLGSEASDAAAWNPRGGRAAVDRNGGSSSSTARARASDRSASAGARAARRPSQ